MFFMILKSYWKQILALVMMLACFFGGRMSMNVTEVKTSDKVSEQVVDQKTEHETETRRNDKVTTIVKKPDGTTIQTIVDHTQITEKKTETDQSKTNVTEIKTTDTKAAGGGDAYRPDFSAGGMMLMDRNMNRTYQFTAGYRLIGNAWLQAGYQTSGMLGIGGRIDF